MPEPVNQTPLQFPKPTNSHWFLLSFFDGISCSRLAMDNLQRQHNLHIHHMAWETDPTCIQISHHHYPDMEHRGNIVRDNPQAVADRMQFLDPDQSWSIAITAGPPCPDFSRVKGSQGEGRDGAEGKKFDDWLTWLEELLPLLGRRPVLRLVETQTLVDRHQLEPTRAHNLGTKGHMVNTVQHPCPSPGRAKGHTTHRSTNLAATPHVGPNSTKPCPQ